MNLLVIPGDGIGPEICDAAVRALEVLIEQEGLPFSIDHAPCGLESLKLHGTTIFPADLQRAKDADAVILGPMSVNDYPPPEEGGLIAPGIFRRELNLYANVRPVYTRPALFEARKPMDLVFVRENLEDFYVDRSMYRGLAEMMVTEDVAIAIGKITAQGSKRIARVAFDLARTRERRRVTAIHKAPVLQAYYGLFLDSVADVAKEYPDVEFDDLMVDAASAHLVRSPERFDVVVTPNMFGDILSDLAAELAGSLGLGASVNFGDGHFVAQAAHGSATDIAGQDLANPSAMLLSVAMLLVQLGINHDDEALRRSGARLRAAVDNLLTDPATRTKDLGGALGTAAFSEAVVSHLRSGDGAVSAAAAGRTSA